MALREDALDGVRVVRIVPRFHEVGRFDVAGGEQGEHARELRRQGVVLAEGGGGVVEAAVEVGRFGEVVHCYGEAGAGVVGPGGAGGGRGVWHFRGVVGFRCEGEEGEVGFGGEGAEMQCG